MYLQYIVYLEEYIFYRTKCFSKQVVIYVTYVCICELDYKVINTFSECVWWLYLKATEGLQLTDELIGL